MIDTGHVMQSGDQTEKGLDHVNDKDVPCAMSLPPFDIVGEALSKCGN